MSPRLNSPRPRGQARLVAIALVATCAGWVAVSAAPQGPLEIDALMTRIGERVAAYHRQAERVTYIERSTVQPIESSLAPAGFARTVESEVRIESDLPPGAVLPDFKVIRAVRRINGKPPREREVKARAGCTDPNPLTPEPLAFLLPANRGAYRFTSVRDARDKGRVVLVIDFVSVNRESRLELVEDERGHDDCFDWSGPLATRGRVWVDANTHDVVRTDRHLTGLVDIRVPRTLQREHGFGSSIVLERDDLTVRYKPVTFSDPDEVLRLPESIDAMTVLRGSLQSIRRTDTFTDYRRFVATGRVVKQP